jgi:acetyl-CoA C-acetyltransferase
VSHRVAICAVAQTKFEPNKWRQRMQGLVWEVVKQVRDQVGLPFGTDGIEGAITVSDDLFDARTISDNAITDVAGAHFLSEEKVAADGAQGVYYAAANILSGHHDCLLLVGHCKESQGESRNQVTHLAFDPFFTRPVGLDYLTAGALQAQAYMRRSGVTEEQLAQVVVKSREWAAKNPVAQEQAPLTAEEVLASPYVADPIREKFMYPVSDGAVAMILASEKKALELTDKPVWITGAGNCYDTFYLGERDLGGNYALERAAERAYRMAGVGDARSAFDVVEIAGQYAHQVPQYAEGLGLCEDGAAWLRDGGLEQQNVNRSGGMLAGNPLMLGGLARAAECVLQLRGEAGERQVEGAKCALAHGQTGPAGQLQTVLVFEN